SPGIISLHDALPIFTRGGLMRTSGLKIIARTPRESSVSKIQRAVFLSSSWRVPGTTRSIPIMRPRPHDGDGPGRPGDPPAARQEDRALDLRHAALPRRPRDDLQPRGSHQSTPGEDRKSVV